MAFFQLEPLGNKTNTQNFSKNIDLKCPTKVGVSFMFLVHMSFFFILRLLHLLMININFSIVGRRHHTSGPITTVATYILVPLQHLHLFL